jgi:hypothetical protein
VDGLGTYIQPQYLNNLFLEIDVNRWLKVTNEIIGVRAKNVAFLITILSVFVVPNLKKLHLYDRVISV